jgi:hypothetical protein
VDVLKDTLNELLLNKNQQCKFGNIFNSLDLDTQAVLVNLIKNTSISVRSIHSALVSENIEIGRTSIDAARRCVLGQSACKCEAMKGFIQ